MARVGRQVPCPLSQYVRKRGMAKTRPVLKGVAPATERRAQADPAIRVARNLLAPPVGLVHDRPQLLHSERRLGYKLAVLSDPRTVSHVHLDPISAVVELFAGCLASLGRPIDKLSPFRHFQLRRITFQRISARGPNGSSGDEKTRPGGVAPNNRLLDTNVAIAGAFRLHVAEGRESLLQRAPSGNRCPRPPQG